MSGINPFNNPTHTAPTNAPTNTASAMVPMPTDAPANPAPDLLAALEAFIASRAPATNTPAPVSRGVTVTLPDLSVRETPEGEAAHACLPDLLAEVQLGHHVLLTGPTGSGKSYVARQVAELLGYRCELIGSVSDSFQIAGYRDAQGAYQPTAVSRWAESQDTPCVLCLDEVDGSDANAVLCLNEALSSGRFAMPDGTVVQAHKRSVVIATANTWGDGPSAEYVGRNALDTAFLARFTAQIPVSYDWSLITAIIENWLPPADAQRLAASCRKVYDRLIETRTHVVWAPRDYYALARRIACKHDAKRALQFTALQRIENPTLRKEVLSWLGA